MPEPSSHLRPNLPNRHFATTQWSIVLAAGDAAGLEQAREALTQLCNTYWYPLYVYVRRRVDDVHEAQDLTQAFFTQLLEKQTIGKADRERGRFRAFLLTSLQNFLANQWAKDSAEKRGGGVKNLSLDFDTGESRYQIEPASNVTPEMLYERRWIMTMLDQVLEVLRAEMTAAGKTEQFERFKGMLAGEGTADEYEQAAQTLGISASAAKQAAYRMRKRYRQLFRDEVARTVAKENEIDEEIGRLIKILGG